MRNSLNFIRKGLRAILRSLVHWIGSGKPSACGSICRNGILICEGDHSPFVVHPVALRVDRGVGKSRSLEIGREHVEAFRMAIFYAVTAM